MSYNKIKLWRYKSRQRALDAFGHKCGICGYDKCDRALSFHHLDTNKFAIYKNSQNKLIGV